MTNEISFSYSDMGTCKPVKITADCTPGTGVDASSFTVIAKSNNVGSYVEVIIDKDINLEGKTLSCTIFI